MRSLRTATKSSPHSLQLENACSQQRRPNTIKNKLKKKKTKTGLLWSDELAHASVRAVPGSGRELSKHGWHQHHHDPSLTESQQPDFQGCLKGALVYDVKQTH